MSSRNSGRIIGRKPPLKPKEVRAIRNRLQMSGAVRDLALFNLAIDSKLRACDLVAISVADVAISGRVRDRAIITKRKTGRPVQFELTDQTREAVGAWVGSRRLVGASWEREGFRVVQSSTPSEIWRKTQARRRMERGPDGFRSMIRSEMSAFTAN
ncbi:integrase [Rhizobium mongolense]